MPELPAYTQHDTHLNKGDILNKQEAKRLLENLKYLEGACNDYLNRADDLEKQAKKLSRDVFFFSEIKCRIINYTDHADSFLSRAKTALKILQEHTADNPLKPELIKNYQAIFERHEKRKNELQEKNGQSKTGVADPSHVLLRSHL